MSHLELIHPATRCPRCFSDEIVHNKKRCFTCFEKREKQTIDYVASCFDYMGPIETVVQEFKYNDSPYLAKSLGAFLFLQFTALQWPKPDYITFIPHTVLRKIKRGYNQSELLAKELSKYLERPVVPFLKKEGAHLQQTKLERKGREELRSTLFSSKLGTTIEDKVILLIDDVLTTGTTLMRAGEILQSGYPKRLYALTLCRS